MTRTQPAGTNEVSDWHRSYRQAEVLAWTKHEFGEEFTKPRSRALRFLEEALELSQAVGLTPLDVFHTTNQVFTKPTGDIEQEFGGVGVTLLALGESLGIDVDYAEAAEIARVLSKPKGHFKARQEQKEKEGMVFV